MNIVQHFSIKVIIGLGNPGKQFDHTRHNIGFAIVNAFAEMHGGIWHKKDNKEIAEISVNNQTIVLIKPLTFMNNSGKVIPALLKQGVTVKNLLVIHDELEKPFGKVGIKVGGSHKGHNGLRSIIEFCGSDFIRLYCGIGRPIHKEDVSSYVLSLFSEPKEEIEAMIANACSTIEKIIIQK
jgi:peptidyl-tRNA hydrolase, PTH1 family